jgi:hypothetical protein
MTADEDLPVIARFEVRRRSYLAPDGTVLRSLPGFVSDTELLISLLRAMTLLRAFDLKAVALQRTEAIFASRRLAANPIELGIRSPTLRRMRSLIRFASPSAWEKR